MKQTNHEQDPLGVEQVQPTERARGVGRLRGAERLLRLDDEDVLQEPQLPPGQLGALHQVAERAIDGGDDRAPPLDRRQALLRGLLDTSLQLLSLDLDLWRAQNVYFSVASQHFVSMKEKADQEDLGAQKWVELFHSLEHNLHVRKT